MTNSFMKQAIELAVENVRREGGPFAALVVKDGIVIATGANQVTRSSDPTAHAEIVAIREACRVLGDFQLTGCDIYTSCDPCPMCLGAIFWLRPRASSLPPPTMPPPPPALTTRSSTGRSTCRTCKEASPWFTWWMSAPRNRLRNG